MNPVESILLENIGKGNSLFVFPTDIAASRWADRLLCIRGGTVAMDKFVAWDTFKQNSVKAKVQNRRSVPAALRKIFASCLVRENAELCRQGKTPLFSALLPKKWAGQAASFANYLAALLPQLGAWLAKAAGVAVADICGEWAIFAVAGFDSEDRDLYYLAMRYAQFLEKHELFEPAWERPPFDDDGKECFIFFPEALSDFGEYREILSNSIHVHLVSAPDVAGQAAGDVFFYDNSRSEIAAAALYIMSLHEQGLPWDSISLSISDAENYEPYVLRELDCRNIPFAKQTGKPLASYPAGRFFSDLAACAAADFSFTALAALVLNRHLPWKNVNDIQNLVDFGIKNNCISSWVEEGRDGETAVNVWEDSFEKPFGYISSAARHFFEDLKWRVAALRGAKSFADVRKHYFSFRERFFDMDKCLPETDLVLSRCVKELVHLAEIEKSFPDVAAPDPYLFFAGYLGEVNYVPQQAASGVTIIPYRTAAPAPFGCHVVVGASQENLSEIFSRMGFLPRGKRKVLGVSDDDVSAIYINLHRLNSERPAAFFCAEQSFSGYAIPHSLLNAPAQARRRYGGGAEDSLVAQPSVQFSEDLFAAESSFIRQQSGGAAETAAVVFPVVLHKKQKDGFAAWVSRRKIQAETEAGGKWAANEAILERIRAAYAKNSEFPGKFAVSASSLAPYFQCSLRWVFERVLRLENIRIETSLMKENISGVVYHAILNHFFAELKSAGVPLAAPVYSESGVKDAPVFPGVYRDILSQSIDAVLNALPMILPGDRREMSSLTARLLRAEKKNLQLTLENCLAFFLSWFAGFRVVETEKGYTLPRSSGYLNGTVDCILEDAREHSQTKDAKIIVDFKLKNLPKRADCIGGSGDELANFQLPMYLALAEGNGNRVITHALFFSIVDAKMMVLFGILKNESGKTKPEKSGDRILREDELFGQIMGEFEEKAERFAREIGSGRFSVFSTSFEKCGKCEYRRVCRTVYRISQERNVTAWGNNYGD